MHALRNGLVSGVELNGLYICPDNIGADRPAGTREALPGTICRDCALRFKRKGTRRGGYPYEEKRNGVQGHGTRRKIVTALAVRKHLPDAGHVGLVYERQLLQLAHAARRFGAHQVALAGMTALDFAVGGDLEALPGSAVRFQLQFWF